MITRRVIQQMEGDRKYINLDAYSNPETPEFQAMVSQISQQLNFTSLRYNRLDDIDVYKRQDHSLRSHQRKA